MKAHNSILRTFAVTICLPFALTGLMLRTSAAAGEPVKMRLAGERSGAGDPSNRAQTADSYGKDFDATLNAVSERFHVAIIAEGAPIHATLTDDQFADLKAALASSPPEARPVLTRIAAAFDYDLEETRYHVFLLRKRYTDPHDLPCVTYDELVHALREIDRLASVYGPVLPQTGYGTGRTDNALTIFAASLRPDQLLAANKGLWANELDLDQQNLALNAAVWTLLNSKMTSIRTVLDHLVTLQNPKTTFGWMTMQNKRTFGYEGPFGKGGRIGHFPLSNLFRSHASGSHGIGYGGLAGYSSNDPTLPTDEDMRLAKKAIGNPGSFCISLRQAVMMGSPTAPAVPRPQASGQRLTVEDSIADKPLSVFGLRYCTENQRIRSIADLYGLKVSETDNSSYSVRLPVANMSGTLADLPAEITRLIPPPLTRAVESQIAIYSSTMPRDAFDGPGVGADKERRAVLEEAIVRSKVFSSAADGFYYSGVRRVLVLAQPAVPSPGSPRVPFMLLNPEVRRADAIAMVAGDCAAELLGLANLEVPQYVQSTSALNIIIGYKEGIIVTGGFGESDPKKRDGNNKVMFGTTIKAPAAFAPKTSPVVSH